MRLKPPVSDEDHSLGPTDAPVTLVEYGDFQCPMCGHAYREVNRLRSALGDQLRLVFRHFPLTQVHPDSLLAAEAAEAAGAQGRFWEMHDLLFQNQRDLEFPSLLSYARELSLNHNRFVDDLERHRHQDRIRRDFMSGVRSGVAGTPSFFINGHRHDGSYAFPSLLAAIQGEESPYPDYP